MTEATKPTNNRFWMRRGNTIKDQNGQYICFLANNPDYVPSAEEIANLDLIAEAGTVLHETGYTPRALLAENASNHKAAFKACLKMVDLEAKNKRLNAEMESVAAGAAAFMNRWISLEEENKRLRSDAERYLWLKKNALKSGSEYSDIAFDLLHADNTDNWDTEINLAIAQGNP